MNNFLLKPRFSYLFFFLFLIISLRLNSQPEEETRNFYFDAVVFRSETDSSGNMGRLDVFTIIPYQSLDFIKSGSTFGASYEILVKISDKSGKPIDSKLTSKTIKEKDYFTTQGGNAKFEFNQIVFTLKPGNYDVEVLFTDKFANKSTRKTRDIAIVEFGKHNFTLSGIMFVSSIEEKGSKFVITPHVSDNIGELKEGFFIFFETYSKLLDSVDLVYEFRNRNDDLQFQSQKIRLAAKGNNIQHFIKIKLPAEFNQSQYKLRLIAMKPNDYKEVKESDYLAITERTIKYFRTIGNVVFNDITKAIKQLRYVATGKELDNIEDAPTPEEKQKRFDEFWKNLDPSPNTERNEAFEEYYARVDFADKNFRSYTEGWNTDKGMVFIVYGRPMNIEKTNPYSDARSYERWTYGNNRVFIFVDNHGFGEYRLYQPLTISDKYRYEK